jgi:hypothetical protein
MPASEVSDEELRLLHARAELIGKDPEVGRDVRHRGDDRGSLTALAARALFRMSLRERASLERRFLG